MPKKILLIDDEADYLSLLGIRLKKEGYTVLTAASGEKGLQILKDQAIDVVLLDIMMAGIDGFEVLRQLKALPSTRNIPIIMVSACTQVEDIRKAASLGAIDYVGKTEDSEVLFKALQEALAPILS